MVANGFAFKIDPQGGNSSAVAWIKEIEQSVRKLFVNEAKQKYRLSYKPFGLLKITC